MALAEFNLIKQFFTRSAQNKCTRLSVGDDCALLAVPEGYELAITTDTMVENVHFFSDVRPEQLGYKLLAVNLSDLASMGAEPMAITLALTMPEVDSGWLAAFADGLFALADKYQIDLIGGDTSSGPLTLSIQAMGLVPKNQALKRAAARVGDLIYVTGYLGDAGLGLKIKQGYAGQNTQQALQRFNMPEPRVEEGLAIRSLANACIDISDGLAQDLGHILKCSKVGARLDYAQIPMSEAVLDYMLETGDWQMPLVAGDDYELCFTITPESASKLDISCTCIGIIEELPGLRLIRNDVCVNFNKSGFEHFA
ncbi:thiamine-monophosphate kinase [Bathymodiolus platifrons methanotrophic gill symbiont]|uniref:thiamine-phosphate kinase n=1 Tax=Bathymodiolus platifrons methanotrophic gill symbiont TaxID=113268 RepID=UPI000B422FD8|nr:thiamine-phosphate kinase [Bathymodiolus platifrons methanotrophic gill symbiont]MCK5869062.1 thiamine-phosphate kinase [Methyloprofundus sp.]TXK94594.1 thiamine-phosphate kinase [Methylococcaceae bacterium CS4]TXK99086.1 thiamine-phosphate kinase [Methylococcaceae bacterium CS5]TXL04079.1 thiamine-phosphate kinase [Methylococcaceae bacterium CS1]TXL06681.1 thiamine-phosphate kinase [Methylococcaceae bacterium CS3]TXL10813.1 thiamine-phosphate kinase [Methylococcaceae bacterium CS2]TXL131